MRTIFLLLCIFFISLNATANHYDWGQTGHRTTAAIAEKYLSNKTKRNIEKLLGRETLIAVSTYGDEIKSLPEMRKYSAWHYVNITPGMTYEMSEKNPEGDLVMAINTCTEALRASTTSRDEKIFYLKMLVHLIGDLHQPLHTGRAEDKGGNDIQVQWFNSGSNLHSVWDTKLIESYGMSYSELTDNYAEKSKQRYEQFSNGNLMDWLLESQNLVDTVYSSATKGEKLGYAYEEKYKDIVFLQLEKGGIRLASVLNSIFG